MVAQVKVRYEVQVARWPDEGDKTQLESVLNRRVTKNNRTQK